MKLMSKEMMSAFAKIYTLTISKDLIISPSGSLLSNIILLKYKYFSLIIHPSICGA